jgi:hypothetical protein
VGESGVSGGGARDGTRRGEEKTPRRGKKRLAGIKKERGFFPPGD